MYLGDYDNQICISQKINQQSINPDGPQSQTHLIASCIILHHKFGYGLTNQKTTLST